MRTGAFTRSAPRFESTCFSGATFSLRRQAAISAEELASRVWQFRCNADAYVSGVRHSAELGRTAQAHRERDQRGRLPRTGGSTGVLLLPRAFPGHPVCSCSGEFLSADELYRRYRPSPAADRARRCARFPRGTTHADFQRRQWWHSYDRYPGGHLEQFRGGGGHRRQSQPRV